MLNLGLYLTENVEKLVDLDTGEILVENETEKHWYLQSLQNNSTEYTLQFI